jgi:hypothetical protein
MDDLFVGIDYSLTCPCACILGEDLESSQFYFLTNDKRLTGSVNNIHGHLHEEYTTEQQRYLNIANFFIDRIPTHSKVMIEDYSFGSKGKVFHIAENCGLLKYRLWETKISFSTVPPTVVKKYATGKGNATKEKMYEAFIDLTGKDLISIYSPKGKLNNPVTDIVDSYFLALYNRSIYYTKVT